MRIFFVIDLIFPFMSEISINDKINLFIMETGNIDKQSNSRILPEEICLVGDRVLTDIVMGNYYGMLTI